MLTLWGTTKAHKNPETQTQVSQSSSDSTGRPHLKRVWRTRPWSSLSRAERQTSDLPPQGRFEPPVLPYHFTAPQRTTAPPAPGLTHSEPTTRGEGMVVRRETHSVWTQSPAHVKPAKPSHTTTAACAHTHTHQHQHLSTSEVSHTSKCGRADLVE